MATIVVKAGVIAKALITNVAPPQQLFWWVGMTFRIGAERLRMNLANVERCRTLDLVT